MKIKNFWIHVSDYYFSLNSIFYTTCGPFAINEWGEIQKKYVRGYKSVHYHTFPGCGIKHRKIEKYVSRNIFDVTCLKCLRGNQKELMSSVSYYSTAFLSRVDKTNVLYKTLKNSSNKKKRKLFEQLGI